MAYILFNSVSEFIDEMEKDHIHNIDRGIVRVSHLFQQAKVSPHIHLAYAVASYKNTSGDIVKYAAYVGDLWRVRKEEDEKVYNKLKEITGKIEEKARQLKLEVRTGLLNHKSEL